MGTFYQLVLKTLHYEGLFERWSLQLRRDKLKKYLLDEGAATFCCFRERLSSELTLVKGRPSLPSDLVYNRYQQKEALE